MYEYAVTLQVQPRALQAALALLQAELTPLMIPKKGLLGLAYVPRYEENTLTILSLWKSAEDAASGEICSAYRSLMARLEAYLVHTTRFEAPPTGSPLDPLPAFRLN